MTTTNYHLIFPSNIILIINGKQFSVKKEDPNYKRVVCLAKDKQYDVISEMLDTNAKFINKFGITISSDGIVSFEGETLPKSLNRMIINLYKEETESIQPLINFWKKLKQNPSYRPFNFLSDFIEKNNVVINPEGNLILYKIVARTEDPNVFLDLYTRTIRNEIGKLVSMPRNAVDDDSNVVCSKGFHACTWNYLPHYGHAISGKDAILLVEINPKDIVAVPYDYNYSKLRVSDYIPLLEYKFSDGELNKVLMDISNDINNNTSYDYCYEEEEEDEDDDEYED